MQLLKKLSALIVMMMFSISFIYAQVQCKGDKVRMCRSSRSGTCDFMCVAPTKVDKYEKMGWGLFCSCTIGVLSAHNRKTAETSETGKTAFNERKPGQSPVVKGN